MLVRGMSQHFGQKFRGQWPTTEAYKDALTEWVRSVQPYGAAGLTAAFTAMKAQHLEWPPSLPAFLGLLEDGTPKPAHAPYRALPKPKPDPAKGAAALAAMRQLVR